MNWHIRKIYFARLCLWISSLENVVTGEATGAPYKGMSFLLRT